MEQVKTVKEGYLRKRKAKSYQWLLRYFTLSSNPQIKKDQAEAKKSYVPGCVVTPIDKESLSTWKGKKLFSFWVVRPNNKLGGKPKTKKSQQSIQMTRENLASLLISIRKP